MASRARPSSALSLIDTTHPGIRGDYDDPAPFTSFGRVMAERRSDWLHLEMCQAVLDSNNQKTITEIDT